MKKENPKCYVSYMSAYSEVLIKLKKNDTSSIILLQYTTLFA